MSNQQNGSSSTSTPASDIAKAAKHAFEVSQLIPSSERIDALNSIKRELHANRDEILAANREDLEVYVVFFFLCKIHTQRSENFRLHRKK